MKRSDGESGKLVGGVCAGFQTLPPEFLTSAPSHPGHHGTTPQTACGKLSGKAYVSVSLLPLRLELRGGEGDTLN